jgi:2-iminobutanoate/2-iminopropanoate deaminase
MESHAGGKLRAINAPDIKAGGHYSTAMAAGGFVFVSGQTPRDANRNIVGDTIEEQTAAALDNVVKVLAAAGATLEDVVKTSIYLTDLGLFQRFNTVYARYFPNHKPARTTLECGLQGVSIEIDVVAYVGM